VAAPVVLTIAGSDPSGGAGLQADLKTFAAFGVYGASVVTALTAQDTTGVRAVAGVPADFVAAQLDAVLDDLPVAAAKTGMLFAAHVIGTVAAHLAARPVAALVVDPVMVATSGDRLLAGDAVDALRDRLLPLARVVTPNLAEAAVLVGRRVETLDDMHAAARALVGLGARAALVKGGHLRGDAVDVLCDGAAVTELRAPRVPIAATHGSGCTLSAAIAAGLARGLPLADAVARAKRWVSAALARATPVGRGAVPLDHGTPLDDDVAK
jgi:hydroxymethylpyrimidine/phosphomethylpyrimidine kinase